MRVLLLNPPNSKRIQRRYMCSYNAPNFLLPPHELIALGGILNQFSEIKTVLLDAIAESKSTMETIEFINAFNPDLVISIQGFECFEEDIEVLNQIKVSCKESTLVLFGHYATYFSEQILNNTGVDIIIHGEPDLVLHDLLETLLSDNDLKNVNGISYIEKNKYIYNKGELRIKNTKLLPFPAYELLKENSYFEPFLQAPFGLIQSARGCPYSCNYCVRSFGQKLSYRTTEQILDEIKILKDKFNIKSLRFIDDTFTASKKRVLEICQLIIKNNIKIKWTCLSRVDTIDEEMISSMQKAGCKRIYFGIESANIQVLEFLNKQIDINRAKEIIQYCRKLKIETFGFFIVGTPFESDNAVHDSIAFAIESKLDYISVSQLTLYPGTELFNQYFHLIDFSLLPYKNEWKDKTLNKSNLYKEKLFYRSFYFRTGFLFNTFLLFTRNPVEYINNSIKLLAYMFTNSKTAKQRSDYF